MKEFIDNGNWKVEKLQELVSEGMSDHIVENIKPITSELNDKVWWMGSTTREFTVKSTYHMLRKKREPTE